MWTPEQTNSFTETLDYYRARRDDGQEVLVALLRETQALFGCIPAQAQTQIAQAMETKESVVAALIKRFPSLHAEAFKHRITVCTGPRCSANGAHALLCAMEETLGIKAGEVTRDGIFALTTQNCLKKCGTPPNLRIDDADFARVTPAQIAEILKQYAK